MQIFANLAKICRDNSIGLPLHQNLLGDAVVAWEFHKLHVAGSIPAPTTINYYIYYGTLH